MFRQIVLASITGLFLGLLFWFVIMLCELLKGWN